MPCIRSNFIAAGLQESTVEIIMSSWRDSIKEKYNIYLKKWIEYCGQNSINPFNTTTYDGLSFLTYMFQSGNGYSSINSARSALSALLPVSDGVSFGRQHLVSKFCRGVFQLRPSLPRYAFTWDIKQLFDYYRSLGENSSLKLKALTLKLSTILALLMSQRAQTIHSLNIEYMKKEPDKITFVFPTLLKNSRPGHHLKPIPIKSYQLDKKLCPVELINTYLDKTASIRGEESKLMISFKKPHKRVTQKTISRWFKISLKLVGIDTDVFKGHSIRSAASIAAKIQGAQMTDILSIAGWSNEETFARYYNKDILVDNAIQDSVLLEN